MKKRTREPSDGSSGSTTESVDLATSLPLRRFAYSSLEVSRILGWGGQATVWQASSPHGAVAIKAFPRTHGDSDRAARERRALQAVRGCPFIVELLGSFEAACERPDFQTASYLCLCLELLQFDLYELIDTHGELREAEARFYAACVVIAVEHIHSKGWAFRDLKPENILIDEQGYPKLTDFGCASPITQRRQLPVGTVSYMSPQARVGDGGCACDWWSLGVLIHEMIAADVPFSEMNVTQPEAYPAAVEAAPFEAASTGDVNALTLKPEVVQQCSLEVTSLVSGLLHKDETQRLGCPAAGGPASVRGHAWFEGICWGALLKRRVQPPLAHISASAIRRPADRGAPFHVTKLGKPLRPFTSWKT
ncbi:hypothetical protein AB1Y20_023074 [Prymnesium parvum]|uniref:Protein kinase domain-containing protein n=1 Tax=Prymnesium parvum TaxID=97485 RepID=A0AB34JD01_PRYPA